MDTRRVAVATITWARTADEEELLGRALARLAAIEMPIAVADRGTSPAFADRLAALPGLSLTTPADAGLVPQVRASLERAAAFGRPFILYVEPDKERFFDGPLQDFIRQAPDGEDVGVVIASRSRASFETFPPMQRYTEGVINHLAAAVIGQEGDYCYGPFLMARALVPDVVGVDPRVGWGWRPYAFRTARRGGLRLVHVMGDYACPPDQREEDERERMHRIRQLSENVLGLVQG